jgi:hypothetical protein
LPAAICYNTFLHTHLGLTTFGYGYLALRTFIKIAQWRPVILCICNHKMRNRLLLQWSGWGCNEAICVTHGIGDDSIFKSSWPHSKHVHGCGEMITSHHGNPKFIKGMLFCNKTMIWKVRNWDWLLMKANKFTWL